MARRLCKWPGRPHAGLIEDLLPELRLKLGILVEDLCSLRLGPEPNPTSQVQQMAQGWIRLLNPHVSAVACLFSTSNNVGETKLAGQLALMRCKFRAPHPKPYLFEVQQ